MTLSVPISPFDQDYELIGRFVEHYPIGSDFDPEGQVLTLLTALGELSCILNAPDAGPGRWALARYDVCTVVTVAAGLASWFGVRPHRAADWPDGCHIGGDGAYLGVHEPHHLLAELVTAAGWVAEWVREAEPRTTGWQSAVAVTELLARAWCLAGRLGVRAGVRALLDERQVSAESPREP